MNPVHRFALLFVVLLVALSGLVRWLFTGFPGVPGAIALFTTHIEYGILSLFSSRIAMQGNILSYDGFAVEVILECVGTMEMTILAAAVLAFPTTWRKKGIGLLMGLPTIYAFNIARVIGLLLVGRYLPQSFDFFHVYFWQGTLILFITAIWLLWIVKVVRDEEGSLVRS